MITIIGCTINPINGTVFLVNDFGIVKFTKISNCLDALDIIIKIQLINTIYSALLNADEVMNRCDTCKYIPTW